MAERKIPAPTPTPETEPFWQAAREGRFLIRVCRTCERAHWYPRALCPFCFSENTEWREASGRGSIYTFSIMRRAKEPYAIAYVKLDEGPMMMTNIVDSAFENIAIDQQVELVFRETEDGPPVPVFRPVQA
ncbi:MAG: Zn-ribbon domain-containing OB-fold protein [Acidobacteriia bacterium]|nr:Zn-ribbon domain-containing OB-fold protein [Methyloceanibacter sp.]MCL6490608.1 Zn-ribbon domain-containing OB-fold protein [Terriglobia bacterium]